MNTRPTEPIVEYNTTTKNLTIYIFSEGKQIGYTHYNDVKLMIDEKQYGKGKNDVFVQHVQNHLSDNEVVICKICGKNVNQIYKEEKDI